MACACGGAGCSVCADYLRNAIDKARACIACLGGEDGLLADYSTDVKIVTRVWDGGEIGLGTVTETIVTIDPRPRVSNAEPRYTGDQSGKFPTGRRLVDRVSLTYTEDDLTDYALAADTERYYLLNNKPYRLDSEPVRDGFGWRFRVARMRARPPSP